MNRMHPLALAAAALAAALPAAAQTYPTRPVRIVVPFAAGGPTDTSTKPSSTLTST